MVIKPKTRGFICTTAHPKGCAKHVQDQIAYAKGQGKLDAPKRVLVVGGSTGYGLASRIAATFCSGADTVSVSFEKPSGKGRTASAGWYNNLAFQAEAKAAGRVAHTINGDAFSDAVKEETIQAIRQNLPGGQVDLVVYSLAAPRRTDPKTGQVYGSVIKPVGEPFVGKTVDVQTGEVSQVEIAPATDAEVEGTVKVMGGEDWLLWTQCLLEGGVLAPGCATISYSYIGPALTHAIYKNGTIGHAKEDLEQKGREIDALLSPIGGKSFVSVNKALVTQASSAIPVVPLYMALLFPIMKAQGTHEDCIGQMVRMMQRVYADGQPASWDKVPVDGEGRIRMDDWEMKPSVQSEIHKLWAGVTTETIRELGDLQGYRDDFFRLFGFGLDGVDYEEDIAEF